jgi:hypothetical protein
MRKKRLDWTTRLEAIADDLDIPAEQLGRILDHEGLHMGEEASERAIAEGYARTRYHGTELVLEWNIDKVSTFIHSTGSYRAYRIAMAPVPDGPQIPTAKPGWKRDANQALKNGDAVRKVQDSIDSRLGNTDDEAEIAALSIITVEDIRGVMDVIDSERKEEGIPTFGQVVGAYEHVESLRVAEYQLARQSERHPDAKKALRIEKASYTTGRELEWAKSYFAVRFPLYPRQWAQQEYGPDYEIAFLLDAILEDVETPQRRDTVS